jgi:hypothetical protein
MHWRRHHAPSAPCFLVRQAFEESVAEQLPGRLEAAIDSDGGSERSQ